MTDGPYRLPSGWRWVRLGEVVIRQSDIVQPSNEPNKLFNYIGLEHLEAGQWTEPEENWVSGAEIRSSCICFRPGYVLYAKLRPYLNKVVVCSREGIASTEFVPMVPMKEVWPDYLGAYLRSPLFVEYASHNTTGSRMPRVRRDALWEAFVPLPPLEEQQRIVAKVEALIARVREAHRLRAEARKGAERLMQAALAETFPRPGAPLPERWRWVRLGEVCAVNPKRPRLHREDNIPTSFVPMSAVDEATGTFTAIQLRPFAEVRKGYTYFEEGDVLFAKITPCMENGKAAIARGLTDGIGFGSTEFHVLRPSAMVLGEWVWYFVRQERFRSAAKAAFRGGVGQQRVPQDFLEHYLIPLPPLDEQQRIVAYLDQVQQQATSLKQAQDETESELKRLEQAILDKAFRGDL